jgi:hypothetical protein
LPNHTKNPIDKTSSTQRNTIQAKRISQPFFSGGSDGVTQGIGTQLHLHSHPPRCGSLISPSLEHPSAIASAMMTISIVRKVRISKKSGYQEKEGGNSITRTLHMPEIIS